MTGKILVSSFLDFMAAYRLHLWNRKKTNKKILRSPNGKAVLVQVLFISSARRPKPSGLLPLLTSRRPVSHSQKKNTDSVNI